MKKLIIVFIAILALSGCSPGYYYPPSYVEVVIVDQPDIPPCWDEPDYEPPPVVQAPPPRHQPIAKTPSNDTRTKTPRNTPTRGEGPPRTKGGRSR